MNRLTGIHFADPALDITYTYDQGTNGKGRLTGMSDPSGRCAYTYDALGNLIAEEKTIDGIIYTTQYTYDAAGHPTGITYPDGRTITYEHDTAGRVIRVTTTKESVTSTLAENITYLPFGPLQSLTYGNGTVVTRSFDALYRITNLSTGSMQSIGYTLDPVGNITGITDNLDPARSQIFGYDDLHRLTSATGIYGAMSYTYDSVGNPLTKTVNSQTDQYVYEAGTNRLVAMTGSNPTTFSYDAAGHITAVEAASHQATGQAQYVYNGHSQRIKKIVGETTTIYHYDRLGNLIGESTPAGDFLIQYVYMGNSRLAAIDTQGDFCFYINNHMGTPQKVVDESNVIVWSADYEPFGEADITVSTVESHFRFPGQYYDAETGLHYNWHRYYAPSTGRYLTPDPIGLLGGINLYPYASNNPINAVDTKGLFVGTLVSKIINKIAGKTIGATAEGTYIAGKAADSAISIGIAGGALPQEVINTIGTGAEVLQVAGGVQTIGIGTIVAGASSSAVLPVVLAGLGGAEIGFGINRLYERISGQSFGADLYDWLHPSREDRDCE